MTIYINRELNYCIFSTARGDVIVNSRGIGIELPKHVNTVEAQLTIGCLELALDMIH